jgi:ABC-2 type transport system ATP-binding protein
MIQLNNISKSYGNHQAVKDVSFKVNSGEVFGFLGPNGAGKTTCIRMITGILPPSSGSIEIHGMNIREKPEECKRITGYIPDRPYLYEKLKGWEFVEFILDLYEIRSDAAIQQANDYFELFDLEFAKYQLIEDYSHGMKQKLVVLTSLLPDPDVIVIDEPMVGLDPKGARNLKRLIRELAERGKTILLSTHTMSVAEEVCDRIAIIHHGIIRETGTMEELRQKLKKDTSLEDIFLTLTVEEKGTNPVE